MKYWFVICFVVVGSFKVHSQEGSLQWYKGNTHAHSYWSDGNDFPEMILDWYKSRDYHFVCLSDHNTLGEGDRWVEITNSTFRQNGFKKYIERYGDEWVTFRSDSVDMISVKLKTSNEYRALYEKNEDFLIIEAIEISDRFKDKPIHLNAINPKELMLPTGGDDVSNVIQNNLSQFYEHRQVTQQPMLIHLNHPNFKYAITFEDLVNIEGLGFIEIHNGHPLVNNYGDETTPGAEQLWDQLLRYYIKNGKPLIYGLATDDAHNFLAYNAGISNPGRGWIMVRAGELTAGALIASMEKGDFYSSTGVVLDDIVFEKNKLQVIVESEPGVDYTIQFIGSRKAGEETILLNEVKKTSGSYKLKKKDLYVRAKIISSKLKDNPYLEGDYEVAWTQPVTRHR